MQRLSTSFKSFSNRQSIRNLSVVHVSFSDILLDRANRLISLYCMDPRKRNALETSRYSSILVSWREESMFTPSKVAVQRVLFSCLTYSSQQCTKFNLGKAANTRRQRELLCIVNATGLNRIAAKNSMLG